MKRKIIIISTISGTLALAIVLFLIFKDKIIGFFFRDKQDKDNINNEQNISKMEQQSGLKFLGTGYHSQKDNNPGNIRPNTPNQIPWIGMIGYKTAGNAGNFLVFDTFKNGVLAAKKNLRAYFNNGIKTIHDIIYKWSPPSDNGGQYMGYVNSVVDWVRKNGFPNATMSTPIGAVGDNFFNEIMAGMIKVETGSEQLAIDSRKYNL